MPFPIQSDFFVKRISLHRDLSGPSDQIDQLVRRQLFPCERASGVRDLFLNDRAVEIVCPEFKRELGDLFPKHYPVCLDMVEIIEDKTTDGDCLKVINPGSISPFYFCVFRMIRKWYKCLKSSCFLLKCSQADEMVDAVL